MAETTELVVAAGDPIVRQARSVLFHKTTQDQIFASLPPGIGREKFAALCLDQLNAMLANLKTELHALVKPAMILQASQRTAALGLIPGKGASEVAWIFRKGWKSQNGDWTPDSIDVMPQWQAYIRLMRQAEGVLDVRSELVHDSDDFKYFNGMVSHSYDPFGAERQFIHPAKASQAKVPHGLRGAYVEIKFRDGRTKFHMVRFDDIETRRNMAGTKNGNDGKNPWGTWYREMVLKTAIRNAASQRVVDWTVDQAERLKALNDADLEAMDVQIDVAQPAIEAPKRAGSGMAGLRQQLGVEPVQTVEVPQTANQVVDAELVEAHQ